MSAFQMHWPQHIYIRIKPGKRFNFGLPGFESVIFCTIIIYLFRLRKRSGLIMPKPLILVIKLVIPLNKAIRLFSKQISRYWMVSSLFRGQAVKQTIFVEPVQVFLPLSVPHSTISCSA